MEYYKVEDTIAEAYKNVKLFNEIAGNLDNVTPESIDNQMSFIYEELLEGIDAIERGLTPRSEWTIENLDEYDPDVELLDAACDMFVTVAGLMQKLEAAGFDVAGALKKVNENNLSKFPPCNKVEIVDLNGIGKSCPLKDIDSKIVEYYDKRSQPPSTLAILNCKHEVIVFKDIDTGKIKKPTNFVPVNLKGHEVVGFLSSNKGGV